MNYRAFTTGLLFSVCFAAMMAATDGKAQTANASSNSSSGSASQSSSTSGATSTSGGGNQTLNATTQTGVTLNQNGAAVPNSYSYNTNNSGFTSSDVVVRTTPTVYAPPVSGGNPCTLAVSGGVSVIGWGASAGGTFVDQDCAMRQKIAMIHNAGYKGAAKELMCADRGTYDAFKTAGEPCAFRPQFEPPGMAAQPQPVRIVTPAPAPMVQAPKEYPRCNPRRGIVDNCQS